MKKLLSLAAVLLTAALIFTGCQNASSSSDDGDKLPGTWSSTAELKNLSSPPFDGISTISKAEANKYIYNLTSAGSYNKTLAADRFTSVCYAATKDADFTGFKATAKCSATEVYGFAFNINIVNETWSNYRLCLNDSQFMISYDVGNTTSPVVEWTQHNAIKASTEENKITVYADKDSTIHILINGTDVYQIKNPALKQGQIGPVCCLRGRDVADNKSLLVSYTFTEFQKK